MPAYGDDELWLIASNVQVQVGSPAQPPPGELPDLSAPANIFSILDIASHLTEPIGKDRTSDLINLIKKGKAPSKFQLKNYADPQAVKKTPSPPPPPSLSPPPPPPTGPPSSKQDLPDLPDNLSFDEIKYVPRELIGIVPVSDPKNPKPSDKTWDPLVKSMYKSFKDFPSAIYIDSINSCISTPYFAPEAKRHRNGVLHDRRTLDYGGAAYLWNMKDVDERENTLSPRRDGVVDVVAQPRSEAKVRGEIYLDSGMREKSLGIENGNSLNSFSLILGITPGDGDERIQAASYSVGIYFGDVDFLIYENQEEAHVFIQKKDPPVKVTIKPTIGSVLTSGYGNKVYILTFIPVWNGLLVAYGIPGSSDWGDSVTFISIDQNLDINKSISEIINPPPKNDFDVPDPNYIPKTVVFRNNRRFKTPGVRIVNSKANTGTLSKSNTGTGKPSAFKMGTRLSVYYYHCGGSLKFVPVYFPQFSRYHFIYSGAASNQDLVTPPGYVKGKPKKPGGPPTVKPVPANENVFKLPTKSKAITMPIFAFQSGSYVDFRTHLTTIVKDKTAPFACFSMEFKSVNPDVRVPIQVWGGVIVDKVIVGSGFAEQAPPNQDGTISAASISVPRIKSVSVQRGYDGATGTIVWDRFDPLTQTVDSRPFQEVGAIQIQVTGGANTKPGIIFTGIAYGNAEEDNPGENTVRIPLKGRESKISSEGGLGLVNVPFFDGYDHRDAMAYMAIYGGFPLDTVGPDPTNPWATPFRLISSYNINNPIVDFPMGTPVSQAMDQIAQYGGALWYFDRFGTCVYIDVEKSTGTDWYYPDLALENFSDEPDHTWVRNQILIIALVAYPQIGQTIAANSGAIPTQAVLLSVNMNTYPTFAWAKMAVYAIPQIVKDINELQRQAIQIAKGQSRPRSLARCRIPGNAQIELLDTINGKWIVNSISHEVDLQRKTWSTDIGVELFIPDVQPIASVTLAPLTSIE